MVNKINHFIQETDYFLFPRYCKIVLLSREREIERQRLRL